MRLTQTPDAVMLEVSDDGVGLSADDLNKPRSFGLRGIRERVASLGGCAEFSRSTPHGTRIHITLPHPGEVLAAEEEKRI